MAFLCGGPFLPCGGPESARTGLPEALRGIPADRLPRRTTSAGPNRTKGVPFARPGLRQTQSSKLLIFQESDLGKRAGKNFGLKCFSK